MEKLLCVILLSTYAIAGVGQVASPPRLSTLSGRVVDHSGNPQPSEILAYQIAARDGHQEFYTQCDTYTDETGTFTCKNLTTGRYFIQVHPLAPVPSSSGGPIRSRSLGTFYYPASTDLEEAEAVSVGKGTSVWCDIKFNQPQVHSVSGALNVVPTNVPLRLLATDGFTRIDSGLRISNRTQDKTFYASAVPNGHYVISADWNLQGVHHHAEALIQVSGKDLTGVALQETAYVSVEGRLTLPQNVNIRHVSLYRTDDSQQKIGAEVNNGAFSFPSVPPGTYYIGLPVGEKVYVDSVAIDGHSTPSDHFVVKSGSPHQSIVVNLKPSEARVHGRLSGWDQSTPVVQVVLVDSDAGQVFTVPVSKTGTYEFTGVKSGDYSLFAWRQDSGAVYRNPIFRMRHQRDAKDISVDEGQTVVADVDLSNP